MPRTRQTTLLLIGDGFSAFGGWIDFLAILTLAAWQFQVSPLQMALVGLPWGLGCFSSNSAQQARLGHAAPALAPALMALNSSAIYLGQAVGAASGGALIASQGLQVLHVYGAAWLLAAVALSAWLAARMKGPGHG